MVMQELGQPRETHVLIRGSHNVKGEPVSPGVPAGACTRSRRISRPIAWAWRAGWSIPATRWWAA